MARNKRPLSFVPLAGRRRAPQVPVWNADAFRGLYNASDRIGANMSVSDYAGFEDILHALEVAWNAGDGAGFGASMTDDADSVTIRADHLKGRQEIIASHEAIFSTIYAGSRNRIVLESARMLSDEIGLVHARSVLEAPTGPLAGRHEAMFSTVMIRDGATWRITSFQITLASPTQTQKIRE